MISDHIDKRYSKLTITMHWLIFLFIIAAYATINLRELYPKGSDPREALKALHFMLGLTVFILVFIQVAARTFSTTPNIYPTPPTWQKVVSKAVRYFLYLLMFAMPMLGWLTLSAAGKTIPFYGLSLPALIAENKDTASTIKEIHETMGTVGYFVIGLHTMAALFHHYIKRDNTLVRMLPIFKK